MSAPDVRELLAEHWFCDASFDGPGVRWSCGIETSDRWESYTEMQQAHLAAAILRGR